MANPFYVQPADIMPGLSAAMGGFRAGAEAHLETSRQNKSHAKREELSNLYQSGTPDEVGDFFIKNPDLAQEFDVAKTAADKMTREEEVATAWDIYTGKVDPAAGALAHAEEILNRGGSATESLQLAEMSQQDPEIAKRAAAGVLARYDTAGFKAYRESQATTTDEKPTANIKDWKHYRKLLNTDTEQASQFARQVGISETEEKEIRPTVAMQNYSQWEGMPEGPEKKAFATMIGISPKDTPAEARTKIKEMEFAQIELDTAGETIASIDVLLNTKGYIDALTGFRGATPFSIPGGTGYDANVAFEQFKDTLTLENMSKMTGILSDSDIEILRSAAAGLTAGMSKKAFVKKLGEIRNRIVTKSGRQRKKLGVGTKDEPEQVTTQEQYDSLPSGAIYVEDGQQYRKP